MKANGPLDWDLLRDDVAEGERNIAPWDDELRGARSRFLLSSKQRPSRPSRRRFATAWLAVAVAASVALVSGVWLRQGSNVPIHFDTGAEHASGRIDARLSAVGSDPLPVHFSDGTSLSVGPASVARVTATGPHGANVLLEEGTLRFVVVHCEAAAWHVAAGPFTVVVTGTKFDVRWSTAEQALALDLQEGSVTVLGPSLGPDGRRVLPGESLRVSVTPERAAAAMPPIGAQAESPPPPAPHDEGSKALPGEATGNGHGAWKQLAQEGRFADALAAAESEGFDAVCRRASPADLLLLGDSARFAGSAKRAEQALQLVRARVGGTHEAAMAAFGLGRIAYDQRRNHRDAARWFQTYVREEPSGGLAREAAGRLIEAQSAAGDVGGARVSAAAYLAKYPAGPHAGLARTVLNQ